MGNDTERTKIMVEREYITIENKAHIVAALAALRGVLPGKEYGVPERQFRRITRKLSLLHYELITKIPEYEED